MKKLLALTLAVCMLLSLTSITATAETTATKLTLWTFISQHDAYYYSLADAWNAEHPDQQIELECVTLGYDEMHNKLKVALQSGEGAPDICDVEVGQFPNILAYSDHLVELESYMGDYMNELVKSRLDLYSKGGHLYGIPYHIGATVTFYNVPMLEAAGIDYTTIKTWDDWYNAGLKLKESNPDVYMGNVETSTAWQTSLMITQLGSEFVDITDEENPVATINTDAMLKAIETQQSWLDAGIAMVCPGGQVDTEEGKAWVASNVCASVTMPLWYMSRFTDEIGDACKDKYAISTCPVFEEGQSQSVGLGGTGTVVVKDNENYDLAAQFDVYAKATKAAAEKIWSELGFDPCNMEVWTDTAVTHDPDNKFNQYFLTNAFDTLLAINEIKGVASTSITPTINTYLNTTLWNEVYVDGADAATTLEEAQTAIEDELF